MNTVTHALLPVIAAGLYERSYAAKSSRRRTLSPNAIALVGVFGAAPDLLNPHLSLAARYTSWSHGLFFWASLTTTFVLYGAVRRLKRPYWLIVPWLSGAYLLHLGCDAISGGIAWAYPFGYQIIGARIVSYRWWVPLDLVCGVTAYLIFRAIPRIAEQRMKMNPPHSVKPA
jgi:putative exporter of polyketide antibiotics